MKTPQELTDGELLESIRSLSGPIYQNLSRIHRQCLAELLAEARRRHLNPDKPTPPPP